VFRGSGREGAGRKAGISKTAIHGELQQLGFVVSERFSHTPLAAAAPKANPKSQ
jgi:hypothetical protein